MLNLLPLPTRRRMVGGSLSVAGVIQRVREKAAALQTSNREQLRELTQSIRLAIGDEHAGRRRTHPRWLSRKRSDGIDGDVSIEAFALITESVRRTTGKSFYDVQLHGGIELACGRIAQMQTGEGKTLTSALPAFVRALRDGCVHVATTNAYLARRDCEELRPAFELLGMSVGLLPEEHDERSKRQAYQCDITFGTGYDFGFDFLRDQLALRGRKSQPLGAEHLRLLSGPRQSELQPLQRRHAFVVVDEADSVLIDEATMPLILSNPMSAPEPLSEITAAMQKPNKTQVYAIADRVAMAIIDADELEVDVAQRRIKVLESGWERAFAALQQGTPLALDRHWSVYIENALRARVLFVRDVDYVVIDQTVQIVDQFTGRIHDQRTWRDGLHQAVETKEAVPVTAESASDARITRQRYFQRYGAMSGMTGTAAGIEQELKDFYGLSVATIPTHRACQRIVHRPRCFADHAARDAAIVQNVVQIARTGQPVLVGTRTIRHSRQLADRLRELGVAHTLLNGLQDEAEAEIVARAGRCHAITIATNMAGRGTDIGLAAGVAERGGLHVIGAEMNLSRRVDRQLAGRAARQGDPGSCQFFVSADDELIGHSQSLQRTMRTSVSLAGECQHDCTSELQQLQSRMEQRGFESRRAMVARDHWLDDILQTLAGRRSAHR